MINDNTGAAPAAPASSKTAAPSFWKNRRLGRIARVGFLLASASVAVWGVLHSPSYQEWRLSRMALPALERERGARRDDPRLLYYVGLRLNQQGRFREADPLLRQAVGFDPHSPRLRDEWARALLGSGLTTAAFGQLREFAGTHPDLASAHFLLGRFYFTQRSMRRASEEFAQAVKLDPGSGESWAYLAGARDALNDMPGAREAAEKAVALRPNNADDHLLLASLQARLNQNTEARQEYARAADLAPRQAVLHREYALWLLKSGTQAGDSALAEAEARKALALDANDAPAQLILGRIRLHNGQDQAALEPLTRAADLAPDDPAPALDLSQTYRRLGRTADATRWEDVYLARQRYMTERQAVWEALRVTPNDIHLHQRMARLLGLHGDVAGCVHHYAMAKRCAIDAPPALIAAANDLAEGGHAADALPLARRAVSIGASNPAAHEALGNALLGLGQAHQAGLEYNKTAGWWPRRIPILKKRLDRYAAERAAHPPPAELAYRQARELERQQFGPRRITPEIESLAQRAVTLEPTNPNYLWYLLRAQMAQRKNEEAIRTARQLLDVAPKDARTHAMLGVLLTDKANKPEEFAEIEAHLKAAESDPSVEATRHYGLGLLALRRQQGKVAARELRLAAQQDPDTAVTYYKLSQAESLAGDAAAAGRALARFRQIQDAKRQEADALSDIGQHPDQPEGYARAARIFDSHDLHAQAEAIRAEAHRRFGPKATSLTDRKDTP